MAEQALNLAVRPALPFYSEWSSALQQEIQSVLAKQKSPQQALDDLAEFTRKLQEKYRS